jgi:hypothetical protein
MLGILMDFATFSLAAEASQERGQYRCARGAAGDRKTDVLAPTHGEQSQRSDSVVDFVSHLQNPLH